LGTRIAELQEAAERTPLNEQVDDAARGLQDLLGRYVADPLSAQEKNFEHELEAAKINLQEAQANGKSLLGQLRKFQAWVAKVRSSEEVQGEIKQDPTQTPVAGQPLPVARESSSPSPGILSQLLGGLVLGARGGIKGLWLKFRNREASPQVATLDPATDLSPEVKRQLEEVAAEVEVKEKQGSQMQLAVRSLDSLRRYLAIGAERGLTDRAQWRLNSRLMMLRNLFPNLRWEPISWAKSTGESALRRNAVVLGLGVQTPNMKIDTTLARRLRGRDSGEIHEMELDSDLEALQQCLLLGAGWRGSLKLMKKPLDRLIKEYGVWAQSEDAARLAAETTYRLVMGKLKKDDLMDFLGTKTKKGPLESLFLVLKGRVLLDRDMPGSLATFTEEATLTNYFFSSMGLILQSSKSSTRFTEDLQKMDALPGSGFHPSVALGLYGAIHGQPTLSARFFPRDFDPGPYLNRAQEEHFQAIIEGS
jgi:hypothetical protein